MSENPLERVRRGLEERYAKSKLRKLSIDEIRNLADRPNVRRIAVENFLITVTNNPDAFCAIMNLRKDAILYNWNVETRKAILMGIELATVGE